MSPLMATISWLAFCLSFVALYLMPVLACWLILSNRGIRGTLKDSLLLNRARTAFLYAVTRAPLLSLVVVFFKTLSLNPYLLITVLIPTGMISEPMFQLARLMVPADSHLPPSASLLLATFSCFILDFTIAWYVLQLATIRANKDNNHLGTEPRHSHPR